MIRATHSGGPNFEILTKFFLSFGLKNGKNIFFWESSQNVMKWREMQKNFFDPSDPF